MTDQPRFSKKYIPERWAGHFDMLNDSERNRAYSQALAAWLELEEDPTVQREESDCIYFADIGCGSGLLTGLVCLAAKRNNRNVKV